MIATTISDSLFTSGIPLAEKAIRTIVVYLAIVVLLRLLGRRDLAQLNSLDLVVLLLLSNIVQNAIIGNDNSLVGGIFGAAVLLAVNQGLAALMWRYDWLSRLLEGKDDVLIEDGTPDHKALRREFMRPEDLATAVRRQGGSTIAEVKTATLKPSGTIELVLEPLAMDANKADIQRLEAKLDRLLDRAG